MTPEDDGRAAGALANRSPQAGGHQPDRAARLERVLCFSGHPVSSKTMLNLAAFPHQLPLVFPQRRAAH